MKFISFFYRKGLWNLTSIMLLSLVFLGFTYLYFDSQLPSVQSLKEVKLQTPLRIYTQDGKLIQEFGEKRRIPVAYKDIPEPLVKAILATEDQRFFEHRGVDILGLGRATLRMIQTGTKSQGGSTITMQVARNFFLSRKKTFLRKFKEILLAIKIDRELPKETILELYLNKIYLGNRAYGVGAAAYIYYGKTLKELTLAQMAMIAGLPQAPSSQNPISNPTAAMKRRNHVLDRMLEEGFITKEQHEQAIHEPLHASYHGANIEVNAPYVAEMIRQSLYQHFGKAAYTRGYKVYTTIQSTLQQAANQQILEHLIAYDMRHGYRGPSGKIPLEALSQPSQLQRALARYPIVETLIPAAVLSVDDRSIEVKDKRNETHQIAYAGFKWARKALKHGWYGPAISNAHQVASPGQIVYIRETKAGYALSQVPEVEAALVSMNPHDGAVEALVGGLDFGSSNFNRATQSMRQPGSSFKPFIYSAALSKGYTLATMINDAPIVVYDPSQPNSVYRPRNAHRQFDGPTRFKEGLVKSKNLVSLRILDDIGIDYTTDFVQRFGFNKTSLPQGLSLALGSLSISPMDLNTAYAVFANGGFKVQPYLISSITDNRGKTILKANPALACDPCTNQVRSSAPRVLGAGENFLMQIALKDVIQQGTGRAAKELRRDDIGGKTGTTNDQVDAWFSGFHQDLVTTVWVGFDNPHSLHEYASAVALPLWADFMKVALESLPNKPFTPPSSIAAYPINPTTGLLASPNQPGAMMEFFLKDKPPEATDIGKNDLAEDEGYESAANQPRQMGETDLF